MATLVGNIKGPKGDPGVTDWTQGYPNYDPRYVNIAGDTMDAAAQIAWPSGDVIGPGKLTLKGASPFGGNLSLWQDANRICELFPFGPTLILSAQSQMTKLMLQSPGGITLAPNASAVPATSESFICQSGRSQIWGTAVDMLHLFGPSGGVAYMQLYSGDSGTRVGYIGSQGTWFRVTADNNLPVLLHSINSFARVQAADYVDIYSGGTYSARFGTAGQFFVQRSTQDDTLVGMHWHTAWASWRMTCNVDQAASLYIDKRGAGAGTGQEFVRFDMTETKVGSITRTSGGVAYNTTSDYRIKDVRGPITGARERIKLLRPVRAVYHADETGQEVDALVAHEVAEVVPEAVTGEKDAVATESNAEIQGLKVGDPILQQLDNSRLIPLLIAAVQELSAKVDELESEIATLKGAA